MRKQTKIGEIKEAEETNEDTNTSANKKSYEFHESGEFKGSKMIMILPRSEK